MSTQAAPQSVERVGVMGGGIMGSGIAEVCARAGIDVILIESTPAGRCVA